jgi:hypothetical protein
MTHVDALERQERLFAQRQFRRYLRLPSWAHDDGFETIESLNRAMALQANVEWRIDTGNLR